MIDFCMAFHLLPSGCCALLTPFLWVLFGCHGGGPAPDTSTTCDGANLVDAGGATVQTCEDDAVCVTGTGCVTCTPVITPLYATSSPLRVEPTSAGILRSRAVAVSLPDGGVGGVTLTVEGPVDVVDANGSPVTSLTSLPATVYLRGTGTGAATLTASFDGGALPCAQDGTLQIQAINTAPLVGRPRTLAPGWEHVESYRDVDPVYLGLDPVRYSDRVGLPYVAYVVKHRSAEEWAADPQLVDVTGGAESGTLAAGALNVTGLWASPDLLEDDVSARYDVVVDFGGDGRLDPGDLVDGPGEDFGFAQVGDLSMAGPHAVHQVDIDGGAWLGERIYWPDDIETLGPRPLIVISHGNGHRYTWYDYIGQHLASWGYVVMAHENNTGPGISTASKTTLTNTDYILANQDTIAGGALAGLIDGTRIAWIGHSRGGEGVVRAYDRIVDGDYTPEEFTAEDIRVITSIAPTVFNEVTDSDPHDVPYFLIAGTADGDVNGGVACDECDFYRLWEADRGPKASAYIHGAGHNDFNCCGFDDATGPDLIGRDEAQVLAKGYFLAMARVWLDGDTSLLDVFRREYSGFTPTGATVGDIVANTFRDAEALAWPVLDDFQAEEDPLVASSGAIVTAGVDELAEGKLEDDDSVLTWDPSDPMNGMTHAATYIDRGTGASFSWVDSGTWSLAVVPQQADTTGYTFLAFSFAQLSRHPHTVALEGDLAFGVTLTDADGVNAHVDFGDQGAAPEPYQRTDDGLGAGWADEFVTVRIPLSDFTIGSMIDLSHLATVQLDLGGDHGASPGAIGLDNVELSR